MGKMSVSIYMKGIYEEFHALGRRKNKANQACPEQRRMEPISRRLNEPDGKNPPIWTFLLEMQPEIL